MKITRIAACFLLCIAGLAQAQPQPDGLQFNVPYLCNDGRTYVVHRCERGPKFEACFYQSGQDSERYNTREAVVYQMTKMCKLQSAASGASTATTPAGSAATMPATSAVGAQPPSDLNNSRWDCGGGTTMTVFQCRRQAGQQACFIRLEQNGKFVTQAPKPYGEIQSHVSACKAMPQFNPAYLAEFPSHYRVVQGMLVGNPADNARRAIGAYYQLSEIIKVLAGPRALTPDEQKFLGDYSRLQGEMAQAAAKMFPTQQFDLNSNPFHYQRNDPKFGFEGIPVWATFLSPSIEMQYARIVGGNDDNYMLAVQSASLRAMKQADNDAKAAQAEASYAKDPGSVAARHCVESGRSQTECLAEAMKVGMKDLAGGDPLKGIAPEIPTGLRLTGVYSANGFLLDFRQDFVYVMCGTLIPQPRMYVVDRSGMQISVHVPISPKPITLPYKADGSLVGPGPIDVAGEVPIGRGGTSTTYEMQTHATTTQRQIDAADVGNYNSDQVHQNGMEFSVDQQTTSSNWVPSTTFHRVPTVPKTEHCNVGTLPAQGESVKISALLTQFLGSEASKSANTKPGLRLNGRYEAPGGLKIEFRDDSATLECGESFNSEGYEVSRENGQMLVKFQNSTGPLSLVLQPNGTLTGSGDVDVAGRKAIQAAGGGVDYLPRNASCSLGTLEAAK